jgi:hypothetical protein
LRITSKNWASFQHYKDRSPAWIKLHKSLLDDFEFHSLPLASRALAPMLWLLASESQDGSIDADPKKIAFRLRMSHAEVKEALKPLIDAGFFVAEQDASNPLAEPERSACLETETYKEEKEGEKKRAARVSQLSPPDLVADGLKEATAAEFIEHRKHKRARLTPAAWDGIKSEALKAGWSNEDAVRKCLQRGWVGLEAEWLTKAGGQVVPLSKQAALEQRNREHAAEFVRRLEASDANAG